MSGISIIAGAVILSPVGAFFLYVVAVVIAVAPVVRGKNRQKIAAGLLLAVSILLSAVTYPKFDAEMTAYRQRSLQK